MECRNYTVDTEFRGFQIIGPSDGSGDTGFDAASNFYNRGTHRYENFVVEDYEIDSAPRSGVIDLDGGYFNNTTDFYINEPRRLVAECVSEEISSLAIVSVVLWREKWFQPF